MVTENQTVGNMPRIGEKAPDFTAITTTGPLKLSEYNKGSWVLMFSHPADFTPVCTTEMSAFAEQKDWFAERSTKLIGLSIDSIHSHLAWVNNVREKTDVFMDFPIIADLDMKVAQLYGMLHPGESTTAAVRAVFFIDPKGTIRLIMYYPLNVGRNMDEIKRALVALQTADDCKCALPIDWRPGDQAIVPPPKTLVEMDERIASTEYEKVDFYLAKRNLN
ncbi:peroxiredoxin [Flavilitoribacter nigricans]|nr:peroxiredoxin [Flavilitoribacter nigricans]